jgi:hypothetical protein
VDANAAASSAGLSYTIRTAAGAIISSGKVQAPQAGAPLLLLVPSAEVSLPGRYILSVGDSEYPFEVVSQ